MPPSPAATGAPVHSSRPVTRHCSEMSISRRRRPVRCRYCPTHARSRSAGLRPRGGAKLSAAACSTGAETPSGPSTSSSAPADAPASAATRQPPITGASQTNGAVHVDFVPPRGRRHLGSGVRRGSQPRPEGGGALCEIPGRTSQATIPTRYAPSPQRSTTHRRTWGVRRCMSTSTAAGSSSGTPNKTTHGAGTWPRTQVSWW